MYAIIEHNSTACAIIEHYSSEATASSVEDMDDEWQWHLLRPGWRENVREYDQEIHNHTLQTNPWYTELTVTRHQEDNLSKATRSLSLSLFPIKMIAKLEGQKVPNDKKQGPLYFSSTRFIQVIT